MIIFIYGEDQFRSRQKLTELLDGFSKKYDPSGLNTARFGAGASMGEVRSAATTPPFLATKRLVALESVWGKKLTKDAAEPWVELLREIPEATVLICRETIEADAATKHPIIGKFPKSLSSRVSPTVIPSDRREPRELVHYALPQMTLSEAASWIEREAQIRDGNIERPAIQELLARVGPDSGLLAQEIAKLVSYAQGRAITKDDVAALVIAGVESDIFAAMDALSARETGRAAELLHGRLRAGDDEFYLLTMLAREIRILLMVKDSTSSVGNPERSEGSPAKRGDLKSHLVQTLKLHPFVVGKALGNAAHFTMDELVRLHKTLFALDWSIKRGKMSPLLALDLFIASLGLSSRAASRELVI